MLEINGLDWDDDDDSDGNVQHIAKHGVHPWEVREVLESAPVFVEAETYGPNPVYGALGYTSSGRLLEVWGIYYENPPRKGWWHTVTAMDIRPQSLRVYLKERGGRR